MPPGINDYDVVIGVEVNDNTGPGSASVKKSMDKMSDDVRAHGDRQARDFARTSRSLFQQTEQGVAKSSNEMVKRLTYLFDTNNFLLRNLARQAGFTTAAVGIGIGKLALSYQKFGKDSSQGIESGKRAMDELRLATSRLGTDPDALPMAIKAAKELTGAYEAMGRSGGVAVAKAGNVLEELVNKRILSIQRNLVGAQNRFDALSIRASTGAEKMRVKINEVSTATSNLLKRAPVNSEFFQAFGKAVNETQRLQVILEKLGSAAGEGYAGNEVKVRKLADTFLLLEGRAKKAFATNAESLTKATQEIVKYETELTTATEALGGAAVATDTLTASNVALDASMVPVAATLAIVVAVLLAATLAVAGLSLATYKGATTAATYGDEIYKLALSTGLTVKTLSTLSLIAKETNTDVDSLAKTFTRTQIQIQRGLDKPLGEAGRALRTLRVNFQELRKANPDQQIFTLAKAFVELNNQNVRATVAQQLFSRDAERQAKMLEQIAYGFEVAQKKAKMYGLELDESGAVKAHMITVAVSDMKMAWDGLWVRLGIKILPQLTLLMETFTEWVLKTGGAFDFLAGTINFAIRSLRIYMELIKETGSLNPIYIAGYAAAGGYSRAVGVIDKEDAAQKSDYDKRIQELKNRGLQGDDQYAPGKEHHTKTDLERLEERVRKLRFEISALQLTGTKAFKLRFELEDLEKVKSGFERILKLRNEMGLDLNSALPQYTKETPKEDLANIESYVHQMERMKTVFDGVRKVADEQKDALADLAKVQQEALMPVVDAGTLSAIKYQVAVRDRMKAEKELTAEVLTDAKLRADAIKDETGATLKAYMTLQRDVGRSLDATRDQKRQDDLFNRIVSGGKDAEEAIRASIEQRTGAIEAPIVPTELMTIAAHAATIDLNVAAIAERVGANPVTGSTSVVTAPSSQVPQYNVTRNPDGTISVTGSDPDSTLVTSFTDSSYLKKKIYDASRQRAGAEKSAALAAANQSIIDNEMRMGEDLIDIDTDYHDTWSKLNVARRAEARVTTLGIMVVEKDLLDLENQNSELYKRTWAEANFQREQNHKALKVSIIELQNEIAHNGEDQADRERKAQLDAIRDIQEASNKARESIIYNQEKMKDATIYHADVANAKVMEFLANQRTITDIIGDAKVKVIDTTFSAIDKGLDKVTDKLGFAKDLVKDIISGFLRLALMPMFRQLAGQGGGAGTGGIFGGGGGVFGGAGGMGPGGTPTFAGGFNSLGASPMAMLGIGGMAGSAPSLPGSSVQQDTIWRSMGGVGTSPMGIPGIPGIPSGMSQFKSGLAGALPLLGMSLGMQAGGQSRFGSILGGAGGLLAGGMGMAALLGTTTGIFAAGGSLAFLAPLLTNPFTAVVAGGLIVGALVMAKKKQRDTDEKTRATAQSDAGAQLFSILNAVRTDQMDGDAARGAIEELHQKWIEVGNGMKDKKTRDIHMRAWNDFQPIIDAINKGADEQLNRANIRERMIPVFAGGGTSAVDQFIKVRPGEGIRYPGSNVVHTVFGKDRGYDTEYMYAPRGTRILNNREMATATPMAMGGMVGMSPNSGELPELHIDSMEINMDADGLAEVVIQSKHFKTGVIHAVKVGSKEKKLRVA